MPLSDLLKNTVWAIEEGALEQIYTILNEHHRGIRYDVDEIEAKIGKKLANTTRGITMVDNVAVIPIIGTIAPRMNLFSAISGGVSAETLVKDIETALEDSEVDAIVLKIDSPGGTVNGTKQVGDLIYSSRGIKPIYTHVASTMASGALWIGTSAERVSAIDTADIGSIGVVMSHYDYSKADEKAGIKRTFLTAGKFKRLVNDAEPLSEEGRKYMQELLDDYYKLFVEAVAQNRGTSTTKVLEDMADGKMFLASKALDKGIIDAIEPIEETIRLAAEAAEKRMEGGESKKKKVAIKTQDKGGTDQMNLSELKEKHPGLVKEIREEASAEFGGEISALKKENTDLKKDVAAKDESIDSLKVSVTQLQKNDAIREAREVAATVDGIWAKQLSDHKIPSKFHDKAKACVDHEAFTKDGDLDVAAFTEAVEAEVKDWKTKLSQVSSTTIQGHSYTRVDEDIDTSESEKDDDAWIAEMLDKAGDTEAASKLQ